MSTQRDERIPELTLGWRLKMSLGDMSRAAMAQALEVDPGTISRWCADKGARPRRVYLMQWALLTGVNASWLETGETTSPGPDDGYPSTDKKDAVAELARTKRARNGRRGSNGRYPAAA